MKKRIVIIGGGASGLTAAIAAARAGASVTIIEHMGQGWEKDPVYGKRKVQSHEPKDGQGLLPQQQEGFSLGGHWRIRGK